MFKAEDGHLRRLPSLVLMSTEGGRYRRVLENVRITVRKKLRKAGGEFILEHSNSPIDQASLCQFVNPSKGVSRFRSFPNKAYFVVHDENDLKSALRRINNSYSKSPVDTCIEVKIFSDVSTHCKNRRLHKRQASIPTLRGVGIEESISNSHSSFSQEANMQEGGNTDVGQDQVLSEIKAQVRLQSQLQARAQGQNDVKGQVREMDDELTELWAHLQALAQGQNDFQALDHELTQLRAQLQAQAQGQAQGQAEGEDNFKGLVRAVDHELTQLRAQLQAQAKGQAQAKDDFQALARTLDHELPQLRAQLQALSQRQARGQAQINVVLAVGIVALVAGGVIGSVCICCKQACCSN